jgi:hypothetical protein
VRLFNRGRDRSAPEATGRREAASLGAAAVAELEEFGRFSYDPQGALLPGDLEPRMYGMYQADAETFLTALAAADHGGWIAYGAERMMVSIAGGDLPHPAYDVVMAQALAVLRANGVPNSRLTGYEWSWWLKHDGADQPWLAGKPAPAAADHGISPLRRGEVRTVAQMTADPAGNILLLTEREPPEQGYAVVIEGPWSEQTRRGRALSGSQTPTCTRCFSGSALPCRHRRTGLTRNCSPTFRRRHQAF